MNEINQAAAETAAVPASDEVRDQEARDGIKALLNGVDDLRKHGLGDHPAAYALADDLSQRVAAFGSPIARGNTVYVPCGDRAVAVDVTPGVLVRL